MQAPMRSARRFIIGALVLLLPVAAGAHELSGLASWYGGKFQGRLTASGEVFDTGDLTAAHRTLPFGTVVEVKHLGNGSTVRVRINDRGPFVEGRVIDLSRAAADALRMTAAGVAPVILTVVALPPPEARLIQVGSFSERGNAERVVRRIADAGMEAAVEQAPGLYRVVIGPVPLEDVGAVTARLGRIGYATVLVRRR